MAILEKRGDSFRVIFYYRSQRFARSLKTDDERKAQELQKRLEGMRVSAFMAEETTNSAEKAQGQLR